MMHDIADTMNFLNEATGRFPDAISLVAGRPPDRFVGSEPVGRWVQKYIDTSSSAAESRSMLGQYSDTNGVCLDIAATYISGTVGLDVSADECMLINGAQEGMLISLASLCGRSKVALTADPTYVGFAGAAGVVGTTIEAVIEDDDFVQRLIDRMMAAGPDIGCIYLVPDFANPTGRVLTLEERVRLVKAARMTGIVLIEDIAYRHYSFDGPKLPTLFYLARGENVILIESFAKSVMPGLRAGILVSRLTNDTHRRRAKELSNAKSYASVTTSPIIQAALAGCLIENDYNLEDFTRERVRLVRKQRDSLLDALDDTMSGAEFAWSKPSGGFFLTVNVGRLFGFAECKRCAEEARVLVLPMQAFSMAGHFGDQIRLSYSHIPEDQIRPAIRQLGEWLRAN